jgi:hypothetical protein
MYRAIGLEAILISALTGAYFSMLWVSWNVVVPLQAMIFGEVFGVLLFLPNGIKILTIYTLGWRGFFYLLPVVVLHFMTLSDWNSNYNELITMAVMSLWAPCISFNVLHWLRVIAPQPMTLRLNWRELLCVGLLSGFLNSILLTTGFDQGLKEVAFITIGDVLGFLVVLLAAMLVRALFIAATAPAVTLVDGS